MTQTRSQCWRRLRLFLGLNLKHRACPRVFSSPQYQKSHTTPRKLIPLQQRSFPVRDQRFQLRLRKLAESTQLVQKPALTLSTSALSTALTMRKVHATLRAHMHGITRLHHPLTAAVHQQFQPCSTQRVTELHKAFTRQFWQQQHTASAMTVLE